jgi:hypothetical protein
MRLQVALEGQNQVSSLNHLLLPLTTTGIRQLSISVQKKLSEDRLYLSTICVKSTALNSRRIYTRCDIFGWVDAVGVLESTISFSVGYFGRVKPFIVSGLVGSREYTVNC